MKIAILGEIHKDGLNFLSSEKFEIVYVQNFEEDNMIAQLSEVEGIVIRTAKLSSNVLSNCKKLRIVSRHGVGYDNVDLNYLNKNNIALTITGQSNAISVAEHVMTMILTLSKNIFASDKLTRANGFDLKSELPDFYELYQKKILILGFGRIGQALAKRCLGFDMQVSVYDPFVDNKFIESKKCKSIDLQYGFSIADYISIHLPLNDKTKDLISKNEFKIFKKNLILINTARGGIINEKALYDALIKKKIYAAGLDVFEKEPPEENNKLFTLDNIIVTPHNSALTIECRKRMSLESCENVTYYLKDKDNINKANIINFNQLKN
tara:strand:+ start:400 stop:1368 length:969 start_codon:yes stop_codon:yes gene_type:complete